MLRLHHVAYFVADLTQAVSRWGSLFGARMERGPIYIAAHGVDVVFLLLPDGRRIELIQKQADKSHAAVQDGRPHHLCFLCSDIESIIGAAHKNQGIVVSPPVPSEAFDGQLMCFILYKEVGLVEFVQWP